MVIFSTDLFFQEEIFKELLQGFACLFQLVNMLQNSTH